MWNACFSSYNLILKRYARRGYRGRTLPGRQGKKRKKEEPVKVEKEFVPKKKIIHTNVNYESKEYQDFLKRVPMDDVYLMEKFPPKIYNLREAIEMHKEVASPEIYDNLDGLFYAKMLINMASSKKSKPIASFNGILHYPNHFTFPLKLNNKILVFAAKAPEQEAACDAGAVIAGGKDLVKRIIKGIVKKSDFDYVICTPEMYGEVTNLRVILGKGMMPHPSKGNVGTDVEGLVTKYLKSISYQTVMCDNSLAAHINKTQYPHLAEIECLLSQIGMDTEAICQNFAYLFETIQTNKPSNTESDEFILKLYLSAPPSPEILEVDLTEWKIPLLEQEKQLKDDDTKDVEQIV